MIDRISADNAASGRPVYSWKTGPQGAATSVWGGIVATSDEVGGRYFEDCHVAEVADGDHIRSGVRSYALDPDRAKARGPRARRWWTSDSDSERLWPGPANRSTVGEIKEATNPQAPVMPPFRHRRLINGGRQHAVRRSPS
jgi:hypothetical protein